jgi:hypothetical protein
MGVRGMDISNHQAGMDVEQVVRDNDITFVFVLSNDGVFKNPYYRAQVAAARRGGAVAVPYVYLRTNVDETYATFCQQEPDPGPVIVDVEDGSGGRAECDRMHSLLHKDGYTTPLLYWPDWYRRKVGSPSLAGLPPLWSSWYPDYVNRSFDQGLAMLPAWVWNGYGGLPTRIVQFTSSGRLSGYAGNLDLNYFPGSTRELLDLLGHEKDSAGGGGAGGDADMLLIKGDQSDKIWVVNVGPGIGVNKAHIPNPEVLQVLQGITGQTVRVVSQWQIDYIGEYTPDPVADVDEEALAAALEARGIAGASPAQVKAAVIEVLRSVA